MDTRPSARPILKSKIVCRQPELCNSSTISVASIECQSSSVFYRPEIVDYLPKTAVSVTLRNGSVAKKWV